MSWQEMLSCKTSIATASQSVWNLLRAEPTQNSKHCDLFVQLRLDTDYDNGQEKHAWLSCVHQFWCKKTGLPSKQVINALYTATFLKILPGTGDAQDTSWYIYGRWKPPKHRQNQGNDHLAAWNAPPNVARPNLAPSLCEFIEFRGHSLQCLAI